MTIITPDAQSARIRFTSPSTNTDVGGASIFYRQNINKMSMGTEVAGGILALKSGAGVDALLLDASGNVGIGTSSVTSFSGYTTLEINNATSGALLDLSQGDSMRGRVIATATTMSLETSGSIPIIFQPAGTEAMRIDSSGNVKIGDSATDITSKLVVSGNASADVATFMYDGAAGTYLDIDCGAAEGDVTIAADARSGSYPPMVFKTSATTRMTLDASGHLLINEPASYAAETVQIKCLESAGNTYGMIINGPLTSNTAMRFFNSSGSGVVVGSITFSASATSYNTSSDYRLKENVVAMSGATERLKQLNPLRFNFIADAETTVDGFLAHEVQDIVPEAITGTKDAVDADGNPEYQGIDQSKLVPLLVATIQELEARIAALES
jgi:hypothetical protein